MCMNNGKKNKKKKQRKEFRQDPLSDLKKNKIRDFIFTGVKIKT